MDNKSEDEQEVAIYLSKIASGVRVPKRDLTDSIREHMGKLGKRGGKAKGDCKKRDMARVWETRHRNIERKKLRKTKAVTLLT